MKRKQTIKNYLFWPSISVGIIAGLIISLTKFLVHKSIHVFENLLSSGDLIKYLAAFILLFVMGLIINYSIKKEPLIQGVILPSLDKGDDALKGRWKSILPYKFLGAFLTLGSGVTMGIEGPSVQIGAYSGQALSETLRLDWREREKLITSGIAAGLAAAFHAPVSGIVYSIEIIRGKCHAHTLVPTMLAAFSSDYICSHIFKTDPVVFFQNVKSLDLKSYWLLLVLSLLIGIIGAFYKIFIPKFKENLTKVIKNDRLRQVLPLLIAGIIGIFAPSFFGAGEAMIFWPVKGNPPLAFVALSLFIKIILLIYCIVSGLPGGVFFPLLIIGSILGNSFGQLAVAFGLIGSEYVLFLSLVAMAGMFSSALKAPLTSIILVMEMTGSFTMLLPLGVVSIISPLASRIILDYFDLD